MKTKQQIRNQALSIRSNIPKDILDTYNANIYKNTISIVSSIKIKSVHCYISYNKEPSTLKLLDFFINNKIKTYVPVLVDNNMISSQIVNNNFVDGPYGILQPKNIIIAPDNLKYNLIIVPTLAFDGNKNRLGYGKGYYDKFLIKQNNAYTIGLCYEQNKIKNLPTDAHDVSLRTIVTQKNVY